MTRPRVVMLAIILFTWLFYMVFHRFLRIPATVPCLPGRQNVQVYCACMRSFAIRTDYEANCRCE